MQRKLEIGSKINNWTVCSEPFVEDGKRHRMLKCTCGKEFNFSENYINRSNFSKSCRSCSQKIRNNNEEREYGVGNIFMNLKILKIEYGTKYTVYVVECLKCGKTHRTGHSTLNKKKNGKGLYCCFHCFDSNMKSRKKFRMVSKNISLTYYKMLERQATLRGIDFNLTPEYLELIYNGYCHFSGIPIKIGTHSCINGEYDLGNASLDRLDSNKDYIEGNVVWVDKQINIMKNTLSVYGFIDICKKIVNHNK